MVNKYIIVDEDAYRRERNDRLCNLKAFDVNSVDSGVYYMRHDHLLPEMGLCEVQVAV